MVCAPEVREPLPLLYTCSTLFSRTIIRTHGDRYVFDRLSDHTRDEGLHRYVFQRRLHTKLPVDFLRQVDVNFASPGRRFPNGSHDTWYYCTESTRSQYLRRVPPLTRPDPATSPPLAALSGNARLHWHAAPSAAPNTSFCHVCAALRFARLRSAVDNRALRKLT